MAGTKLDYTTLCAVYGEGVVQKQMDLEERMAGLGTEAFYRRLTEAEHAQTEASNRFPSTSVS